MVPNIGRIRKIPDMAGGDANDEPRDKFIELGVAVLRKRKKVGLVKWN